MRIIISALIMFTIYSQGSAQGFQGKLVLGANAAQVDGDEYAGYNKAGLALGAAAAYNFSKKIYLQGEILYSQKGARAVDPDNYIYFKWRLNYIDIPLIFNYHFTEKLSTQIGLMPSVFLNSKTDLGHGFFNANEGFDKVNVSYTGGIEYAITKGIAFNARHSYSLGPINTGGSNIHPRSFYNNVITVSLRITLNPDRED
ncbi:MAG: outer membrane beta-barrel protein [Cytophagaceae bacterium]